MQDQEDNVLQTLGGLLLAGVMGAACVVLTGGWFFLQ